MDNRKRKLYAIIIKKFSLAFQFLSNFEKLFTFPVKLPPGCPEALIRSGHEFHFYGWTDGEADKVGLETMCQLISTISSKQYMPVLKV